MFFVLFTLWFCFLLNEYFKNLSVTSLSHKITKKKKSTMISVDQAKQSAPFTFNQKDLDLLRNSKWVVTGRNSRRLSNPLNRRPKREHRAFNNVAINKQSINEATLMELPSASKISRFLYLSFKQKKINTKQNIWIYFFTCYFLIQFFNISLFIQLRNNF